MGRAGALWFLRLAPTEGPCTAYTPGIARLLGRTLACYWWEMASVPVLSAKGTPGECCEKNGSPRTPQSGSVPAIPLSLPEGR